MNKREFCSNKNNEQGKIEKGGLDSILVMINRSSFFSTKFKSIVINRQLNQYFSFYKVAIEVGVLRSFDHFKYNYETVDIWSWPVGEKSIKAFKWVLCWVLNHFLLIVCKMKTVQTTGHVNRYWLQKRGDMHRQNCARAPLQRNNSLNYDSERKKKSTPNYLKNSKLQNVSIG